MPTVPRILFVLAVVLAIADLAWWRLGHFHLDAAIYGKAALLGLALFCGGLFYRVRRGEPALAAMFFGSSFLVIFSAAASVLNSFLLTVAGPNSDPYLDHIDRLLGFDWYRMMLAVGQHPALNALLFAAYNMVMPEIALVMIALAWRGRIADAYEFCLAVALGALTAISLWTLAPGFGAMALYHLPADVSGRLLLSMTGETGRAQIELLRNGPGFITPDVLHGSLIGFPSYHGMLALIVSWYGWRLRHLRWPLLALNAVILVSTPVQGGHHLIDVLCAIPLTAALLWVVEKPEMTVLRIKLATMVNKGRKFTITPVPQGLFRITAEQDDKIAPRAIKPKLSGLS